MIRRLVSLLLLAQAVYSQGTCTVDSTKAKQIGPITCDADDKLIAKCSIGLIRMTVAGIVYNFNSVTNINGDWFGTSCGAAAVFLSIDLPVASCPDEYPDVPVEGSMCTLKAIGLSSLYDQYFSLSPVKKTDPGFENYFKCGDALESWEDFRNTENFETDKPFPFIRSDTEPSGYKKLSSQDFWCELNPATGKYDFKTPLEGFLGTNQIECMYKKCLPFHTYNKATGRCEADNANSCGLAFTTYGGTTWLETSGLDPSYVYQLGTSGETPIPSNMTALSVSQGCKVTVFGSKIVNGIKFPLVFGQTYGLWTFFSYTVFAGINYPASVVCEKDDAPLNCPAPGGWTTPTPYIFSQESKYASISLTGDNSFTLDKYEDDFSYSFSGSGTGSVSCTLNDESSSTKLEFSINFATKKLSCNQTSTLSTDVKYNFFEERVMMISSTTFHIRFIYVSRFEVEVHLNGRYLYAITVLEDLLPSTFFFSRFRIKQENVVIDKCKFFVPKKCGKKHKHSKKSGKCESKTKSSSCALVTKANGDEDWVDSDNLPAGYEQNTSFIEVREDCACWAYSGTSNTPIKLGKHKRGKKPFKNYEAGTCASANEGLKHVECICEDYIKRPSPPVDQPYTWTITGDSIVVTMVLLKTSPMAQLTLLKANGDAPLILFFGEGRILVDNRKVGVCSNSSSLMYIDMLPIVAGASFECHIRSIETGFEIRINGIAVMTYPYLLGFGGITSVKFEKELRVVDQREYVYTGKLATYDFDFGVTMPLLFDDFVHYNGISTTDSFNITLFGKNEESLYILTANIATRKITQRLVLKSGTKIVETTGCSLAVGVEFDIVVVNKPHSIEVYINGEIIDVIGEHIEFAESKFYKAKLQGDCDLFEHRRGPKKIKGEPKWGQGR